MKQSIECGCRPIPYSEDSSKPRAHYAKPTNLRQKIRYHARPFSNGIPMSTLPPCPKCKSEFTYADGANFVCPECAHEWPVQQSAEQVDTAPEVKDAFGNVLKDGDSVSVIKDLKVKGSSLVVKVGTKVKNIKLVEGDHDIDCKIEGIGAMQLKSEFVKKA